MTHQSKFLTLLRTKRRPETSDYDDMQTEGLNDAAEEISLPKLGQDLNFLANQWNRVPAGFP